jgi:hypothetical protein
VISQLVDKVRLSWWKGGIRELSIVLCIYACYSLIQGGMADREALAFHNAYDIISFEKQLNIYWEPNIQSWFLGHISLVHVINALYTLLFYPVLIVFGIWAYKRHREKYTLARNVFILTAVIGLPCFAFYPTAPPRLLSGLGFIDTLDKYQIVNYSSSLSSALANQYAAMPSFHFAWTLLVGISIIDIAKAWWLRTLGILVPLLTLVSIIATANHFILDAVAGAAITGVSYGLVILFSRLSKQRKLAEKRNQVY